MAKPQFKLEFEFIEDELREEVLPRFKWLLESLTRQEEKAKIAKLIKSFNLPTLEDVKMKSGKMSKTSKKDYGKTATKDDLRRMKKEDEKADRKMIKAAVKKVVKGKK